MNSRLDVVATSSGDELRLVVRVARMYHEQGIRQSEIATRLNISQARVSRVLSRANELGIVQTTVVVPGGLNTELEDSLEEKFGLQQAIVVDSYGDDSTASLGAAAADYLSTTLLGGESIGISSWSASLIATAQALRPFRTKVADAVVQLVGGMGDPRVQMQASQLMAQLSSRTGASPIMLPTPGILGTAQAKEALMADPAIDEVRRLWGQLTLALVGIGGTEPSDLAARSGNVFPDDDRAALTKAGAVGDVCFRFFDSSGEHIHSSFDNRVIGIDPQTLKAVPRRVAVAGGARKVSAIRGAMLGNWINVLVTDKATAEALVDAPSSKGFN